MLPSSLWLNFMSRNAMVQFCFLFVCEFDVPRAVHGVQVFREFSCVSIFYFCPGCHPRTFFQRVGLQCINCVINCLSYYVFSQLTSFALSYLRALTTCCTLIAFAKLFAFLAARQMVRINIFCVSRVALMGRTPRRWILQHHNNLYCV